MATNTVRNRDKFLDAVDETYAALLTALEATEQRGHQVSQLALAEARKGEQEVITLARAWADTPADAYDHLAAMIDAQMRAQQRALELARDWLKGAGEYRTDVREAVRRMIRANRAAGEAMVEVARTARSGAAHRAEHLPRLRRTRIEPARPSGEPAANGEHAEEQVALAS
jgi:hypothetical protein